MAEGGNVPQLGGYDYEFTSRVPEYCVCLVCHLTLKDAVQIEECGHRLCTICMESLLRRPSPTCPADRQPLSREKIFSDAACRRQILDLTVICPHSGCSWTGELRAVEKHQSECLFKVVKCPNSGCTKMLSKRDMKTHETLECSWRKVNCEYCQESVIVNQKQKHFDVCRKFPVLCTNTCGLKDIPREKLAVHVRDECPATEVQCEYKNLGCEEVFPRSDAKSHSQAQIESHLNLALRGLEATQHQVHELVTVVKDQSQQIERLISKDKDQSQQIERQSQQIELQSQQIERQSQQIELQSQQIERQSQQIELQSQQIERQSQQIQRLISKDKDQSQQIERLISKDKDQSQQIERLISKDKAQSQQIERQSERIERFISKDKEKSEKMEKSMSTVQDQPPQRPGPINKIFPTPFQWKIPIRYMLQNSESLYSKPFYLFERGYKYSLKFEMSPSRMGTELRMFIKVVPGEFDELLSWPCKEKVRVTVSGKRDKTSEVIDFEKGDIPCFRPLNNDHHEYRSIFESPLVSLRHLLDNWYPHIFVRVNRE